MNTSIYDIFLLLEQSLQSFSPCQSRVTFKLSLICFHLENISTFQWKIVFDVSFQLGNGKFHGSLHPLEGLLFGLNCSTVCFLLREIILSKWK